MKRETPQVLKALGTWGLWEVVFPGWLADDVHALAKAERLPPSMVVRDHDGSSAWWVYRESGTPEDKLDRFLCDKPGFVLEHGLATVTVEMLRRRFTACGWLDWECWREPLTTVQIEREMTARDAYLDRLITKNPSAIAQAKQNMTARGESWGA